MSNGLAETALLIMDVQPGSIGRLPNRDEYLAQCEAAVAAAHSKQISVIFIVISFRNGFPEVSPSNKSFQALIESGYAAMLDGTPALTPAEGDVVVTKRRTSAFTGGDLEVILRAKGIRHLVLAGIATSGVVLSTVREAADKDYQLTVLSDLCIDLDPEVHAVLMGKVFPRQATVVTSQEWAQSSGA